MLGQAGANADSALAVRAGCPDAASMDGIVTLDPHAERGHTQSADTPAAGGRCVQNGHIPPTPRPMSTYRLRLCLLTIGWSERELVRRCGEHRNTVRRWLAGESAVDSEVATWLEILTAFHLANPRPRHNKRVQARTAAAARPGRDTHHTKEPAHRAAEGQPAPLQGKRKAAVALPA